MFGILCCKSNAAGFPGARIKDEMGTEKGSSAFFKIQVELERGLVEYYAGGHMDRKPMLLVSTASTSNMGNVATRRKRGRTTDEAPTYEFDQPLMHATYRRYFNAVDLFNRDALGQ